MSTGSDDPKAADAVLRDAQQTLAAAAQEQRQLNFLEPLSADEIEDARKELGGSPGIVTVMRKARETRGRRKGTPNRRTDDFVRYLSQFGRDPAVTMMLIQSTPPEELVARSHMLDPPKKRMGLHEATGLVVRCAEGLMPYFHSKKPVEVNLGDNADFNLLIPGVNISVVDAQRASEGTFVFDGEYEEVEPKEGEPKP